MVTKKKNIKTATSLTAKQKRNFFFAFWGVFAVGILSIILVFVLIANGAIGYLPPLEELQNPKNKYASEISDIFKQVSTTYYGPMPDSYDEFEIIANYEGRTKK